jgi:hypothetical protein
MDSIYANDLDIRFLVGYVFTLTSHAISWKAIFLVCSSRLAAFAKEVDYVA